MGLGKTKMPTKEFLDNVNKSNEKVDTLKKMFYNAVDIGEKPSITSGRAQDSMIDFDTPQIKALNKLVDLMKKELQSISADTITENIPLKNKISSKYEKIIKECTTRIQEIQEIQEIQQTTAVLAFREQQIQQNPLLEYIDEALTHLENKTISGEIKTLLDTLKMELTGYKTSKDEHAVSEAIKKLSLKIGITKPGTDLATIASVCKALNGKLLATELNKSLLLQDSEKPKTPRPS